MRNLPDVHQRALSQAGCLGRRGLRRDVFHGRAKQGESRTLPKTLWGHPLPPGLPLTSTGRSTSPSGHGDRDLSRASTLQIRRRYQPQTQMEKLLRECRLSVRARVNAARLLLQQMEERATSVFRGTREKVWRVRRGMGSLWYRQSCSR